MNTNTESLLISAAQLQQLLPDPRCVVFDVRHDLMNHALGRQQYEQSHIPGAFFLDNEVELVGVQTGENGRHPLPVFSQFVQLLTQIYGLNAESIVTVYDASQAHMAARTWWLLRWAGFKQVRILDGGWQAWLAAGGATETQVPTLPKVLSAAMMAPTPQQPTVGAEQLLAANHGYTLVDARAAERYRGEKEPIDPVAGSIPGALNRPTPQNLQADGRFKSAQQLRAEFDALLGTTHAEQVVHYCGSGMTACHNVFAMELAGLNGSVIYPGSWSEWIADPARPRYTAG